MTKTGSKDSVTELSSTNGTNGTETVLPTGKKDVMKRHQKEEFDRRREEMKRAQEERMREHP